MIGDILRRRARSRLFPTPVPARHGELSMIFSADDDVSPSPRLLDTALSAVMRARRIDMGAVSERIRGPVRYPDVWPGEHYKLLAALVMNVEPRLVVEIGTGSGLSALAMLTTLSPEAKIVTFDTTGWRQQSDNCLRDGDFADGRLRQLTDDLGDSGCFRRHEPLLREAEMIFIDAAKDGALEDRLLASLANVPFLRPPLVVLDDIRLWNMLRTWRNIKRPKLDLTSFGHWSGTGLVDWIGDSVSRPNT